jgi:DNA-binding transcriptional MerR regulator
MSKALTIGTLARRMGVQPSAVRFYERQGLIASERLANGYRVYSRDAANALSFICRAKALGFSLDQIAEILDIRRRDAEPCACVKGLIERNLAEVERKLGELSRLRRELKALAASAAPSSAVVKVCRIIETAN